MPEFRLLQRLSLAPGMLVEVLNNLGELGGGEKMFCYCCCYLYCYSESFT